MSVVEVWDIAQDDKYEITRQDFIRLFIICRSLIDNKWQRVRYLYRIIPLNDMIMNSIHSPN